MSQTTVLLTLAAAFAGMMADTCDASRVTGVQTEASAEIPFGVMLAKGTGDVDCILPAASGAKLVGVLQHSHSYDPGPHGELGTTGLKPGAVLNVLRRGRIYVLVETNVAAMDRAFVRYAAGAGGTQLGAFRNAAVSSETIDLGGRAQFLTSALAGGVAVLEVDMLNP